LVYWNKSRRGGAWSTRHDAETAGFVLWQEERRLGWNLTVAISYLLVGYMKGRARLFLQVYRDRMRTNDTTQEISVRYSEKIFHRIAKRWNRDPENLLNIL